MSLTRPEMQILIDYEKRVISPDPLLFLNPLRIRHEIEQAEYLNRTGKKRLRPHSSTNALRRLLYKNRLKRKPWLMTGAESRVLDSLAGKSPKLYLGRSRGPVLNPRHDYTKMIRQYRSSQPRILSWDGFLTKPALAELQRFCLEARIWRNGLFNGHYLGASSASGFRGRVLDQIAHELRKNLPGIVGELPLVGMWAFKYMSPVGKAVKLHADSALVNANFWITPDEANRDLESGGMILYDKAAPSSWDYRAYNSQPHRIRKWLKESGASGIRIPYRENRVVIFESNLFHETDSCRFVDSYESRRISVTLLFGRRL